MGSTTTVRNTDSGASMTPVFTSAEVMRILRISKNTLFKYIREEPQFRTFLQGNRRYMRKSDLEAWIESRIELG